MSPATVLPWENPVWRGKTAKNTYSRFFPGKICYIDIFPGKILLGLFAIFSVGNSTVEKSQSVFPGAGGRGRDYKRGKATL